MLYIVSQTIVSGNIDSGEPVEVNYYRGDNLAKAISAMAMAASDRDSDESVPESMRVHTLEVRLDMQAECPWRDVGYSQRVWWAAPYVCGGREVEHPFGTLCGNHSKAWAEAQENMIVDNGTGFTGATSSTDHPSDCGYCQTGEASEHNYEPGYPEEDKQADMRAWVVDRVANLSETLSDPTQAWDIAVQDFQDDIDTRCTTETSED